MSKAPSFVIFRASDVCEACLGIDQTALGRFDTKHDQILVRRYCRRTLAQNACW
jgi:hypothetical protein